MGTQTRKVNLSGGLSIGAWKPISIQGEFDLSSFACYEFLEGMKSVAELRAQPEKWAMEKLSR